MLFRRSKLKGRGRLSIGNPAGASIQPLGNAAGYASHAHPTGSYDGSTGGPQQFEHTPNLRVHGELMPWHAMTGQRSFGPSRFHGQPDNLRAQNFAQDFAKTKVGQEMDHCGMDPSFQYELSDAAVEGWNQDGTQDLGVMPSHFGRGMGRGMGVGPDPMQHHGMLSDGDSMHGGAGPYGGQTGVHFGGMRHTPAPHAGQPSPHGALPENYQNLSDRYGNQSGEYGSLASRSMRTGGRFSRMRTPRRSRYG